MDKRQIEWESKEARHKEGLQKKYERLKENDIVRH